MVALLSAPTSPAQIETLAPIRIGTMAVQPQPDLADRVYVGLAALLPTDLRALCSCAGLFYLHVIREVTDDLFRVAVAAQPRYFSADAQCRTCHVRSHFFSDEQMGQLIEWDRSLAAMETGDVQGLLRMKHLPRIQQQQEAPPTLRIPEEIQTDTIPEPTKSQQEAPRRLLDRHREIDVAAFVPDREGVVLPIDAIRAILRAPSHPSLPTLLIQVVLRQLRAQLQSEQRWAERQAIKQKERRIQQMYLQRDYLPLQELVEMTPIYGRGKQSEIIACRIDIDLLAA